MSIYSAVVIVCTQGKSYSFFKIKFDNADYGKGNILYTNRWINVSFGSVTWC